MVDDLDEETRVRQDVMRCRIEVNRALMDGEYERCLILIAGLMARSHAPLSEAARNRILKAFEQDRLH